MGDQLDLFIDSRAVMLANEAVDALSVRDAGRAVVALERLGGEAPDHPARAVLGALAGGLAGWHKPESDPQAIARAVRWLDDEIAPAAKLVLGQAAWRFVEGFFRDLADAARGVAHEPAYATAHRAGLCLRCGEWAEAEAAASSIPDSARNPDALHWLSVARYRRHGLAAARPSLSRSPGTHRAASTRSAPSSVMICSTESGGRSSVPANGKESRRVSSPPGSRRGVCSSTRWWARN